MKKFGLLVCALVAIVLTAGCGGGLTTGEGKVLVNVNGTKITEGDLGFLGTINPRIQAQIMNPEGKKKLLDNFVEQELLYQDAVKEGVSRKPEVKAKVDLYRRVIIAQSLVDDEIDKAAKKYYDEHPDEFKKLKMSQIMIKYANPEDLKKQKKGAKETVRSEADALKLANEIEARLDKGADFATVAKETSDDAMSKNRGGDLGPVSKDDKRFEARGWAPLVDKAFEMKVGEIAGPIKTNQGYHVITVTQGLEVEPFEEAKAGITFKIRNDVRNELLARLKKEGKIEYAEEEKKPAEKAATAGEEGANAVPAAPGAPEAPAVEAPKTAAPAPAKVTPMKIEVKPQTAKKIAKEAPAAAKKPESAVKKAPQPEKTQ